MAEHAEGTVSSDTAPLADLQRRFVREVLYREPGGIPAPDAESRIAIYRTTARENFALALEAAFPLLLRCMGRVEFRQLAWSYQRACPSPSGNLFHAGERLPAFLADQLRGTEDECQIDVARLEWHIQESMVAANGAEVLDHAALAAVPAERHPGIRFQLHPSVRLLRTECGVFCLWKALQEGSGIPAAGPGPECLLVLRRAAGVEVHRLPEKDHAWLEAILDGATLADATLTLGDEAEALLGRLMLRWIDAGVITSFT